MHLCFKEHRGEKAPAVSLDRRKGQNKENKLAERGSRLQRPSWDRGFNRTALSSQNANTMRSMLSTANSSSIANDAKSQRKQRIAEKRGSWNKTTDLPSGS